MTITTVVNIRFHHDVFIGRPSKWGSPWSHLPSKFVGVIRVATRDEAIKQYELWIVNQKHLLAQLHELKGKRLGCPGCNPDIQICHGWVLADLADALP